MMTNLKLISLIILVFSLISIYLYTNNIAVNEVSAYSSLNMKHEHSSKDKCKEVDPNINEARLKKLTYIAQYFDIQTEGKTVDELKKEIEQAKQTNPEKWALFKKELHDKKIKMLEQKSQRMMN